MEPGVPFALLGAVQLLLVAACVGLAGAAALRRSLPGALVAVGALGLAGVEVRTALLLGQPSSDALALGRAAALLVVATGLVAGGLGAHRSLTRTYGVVVPLAAATSAALFSAFAAVAAAFAAVRGLRGSAGALLGSGFVLLAAGSAVSAAAQTSGTNATIVLVLRGAGAALLLAALVLLAQVSLLSKVVAAILAGVLTMAVAAVGVVGNVVVSSYDRQTREIVEQAADGRSLAIDALGRQVSSEAVSLDLLCQNPADCARFLPVFLPNERDDFVVSIAQGSRATAYGGRAPLDRSELLGIAALPVVQAVLTSKGADRLDALFSVVRLAGSPPGLAVVGVGVSDASPRVGGAQTPPKRVVVYGRRLDTDYARSDVDTGGFGLTLLAGDPLQVIASNRSDNQAAQVRDLVLRSGAAAGLDAGLTLGSQGMTPTARLLPLRDYQGEQVGLLAVTRDPAAALKTERDALRLLFLTAVLALLLVAGAALVLGRRTVDPVRRLTLAAERVAAGDLTAVTDISSRDEVGTLARTFDGMTTSLASLTGDLRASSDRLETVLASMSDGLLATDAGGVVTSVNRAALDLLGLAEQDVLGEDLLVVADVRLEDGSPVALAPSDRDEPALVHRPDRTTVPVRVAVSALQGDEAGLVVVLRDTTREREVERMKTEFLSNVSHELRTPLTPIRGYADMLVSKPGLAQELVQQFSTVIRDEAVKMNRVVDLLVDVAALEAGRVSVTPRAVPVRELLDVRLAAWVKRAPERSADLKRRVAKGVPAVHVDPTWLGKALDELLDNAVKYTPRGTTITLTAAWAPDGERVRVAVRDNGPGIAEADQESLFTSFEQVDGSATRHVGGLGLGLSFVRRLAQDSGYPLTVTSRPGKGAEFALDLPVAE